MLRTFPNFPFLFANQEVGQTFVSCLHSHDLTDGVLVKYPSVRFVIAKTSVLTSRRRKCAAKTHPRPVSILISDVITKFVSERASDGYWTLCKIANGFGD
jgi:hypothetical protein